MVFAHANSFPASTYRVLFKSLRARGFAVRALEKSGHDPRCPVGFIGGRSSQEMRPVGIAMTEKVTHGRIMVLDGSHLFPMEEPIATVAAIEAALRNFSE